MGYPSSFRRKDEEPLAGHTAQGSGGVLGTAKAAASKLGDRIEAVPRTNPLDGDELRKQELQARMAYGRAKRTNAGLMKRLTALLGWWQARAARFRPIRTLNLFFFHYGTVMAAGTAYMMFFSVAALLWAGFSVAGLVIGNNEDYQELIVQTVSTALPGLIGEGGLVTNPQELFRTPGFSFSLALAVIIALVTSLSWLHGLRSGIRTIWNEPLMDENVIFVKLKDFGLLMVLGIVAFSSAIMGLLSSGVIRELIRFLGWEALADTGMLIRLASFTISFGLDMAIAVLLMRVASRLQMPSAAMWQAALIAGIGASGLRLGSTELLQNFVDSRNPLINTFGTVLGVFFYFFIFGLVYLFAASWGAVTSADRDERLGVTRKPAKA